MVVAVEEFLRWIEARGVDAELRLVYRDLATRILKEAGGAPVDTHHVEAVRPALEAAGDNATLAQLRNVGDALRQFQRPLSPPASQATRRPARQPSSAIARRGQPSKAWTIAAVAATVVLGAGTVTFYLSSDEPRGAAMRPAASSPEDEALRQAYRDFEKAMLAGNVAQLKDLTTADKLAELSAPDAVQKLELARALYPKGATIASVKVTGDKALLTAKAQVMDQPGAGRIDFIKENARWKVGNASWNVTMSGAETADPAAAPAPRSDVARPADFPQLIGTWTGNEIGGRRAWTMTFSHGFRLAARSSRGESYAGEVMIRWDLGVENDKIRVPPGWGPMDIEIESATMPGANGKITLAAFSLSGGELRFCGGPPGFPRRVSSFDAPGEPFRCVVMSKTSPGPAIAPPAAPVAEPAEAAAPPGKAAPGQATLLFDGAAETYEVKTGFFSDTRLADPKKAVLDFGLPAKPHSNARRIVVQLDATQSGRHVADGDAMYQMMFGSTPIAIGERAGSGRQAVFKWIADGGQVYAPKRGTSCEITVLSPYTGQPDGEFVAEVSQCAVHSAGIDHTLSAVKLRFKGVSDR